MHLIPATLLALQSVSLLSNVPSLTSLPKLIPDTVPSDVSCQKVKKCDHLNNCIFICERGTVEIDPWLTYALKTQRKLAYTQKLCETQLPGSHNTAITLADGYGVQDHVFEKLLSFLDFFKLNTTLHTNDQMFSVTDQLQMGVRFLELDIHWFDNDLRIAHCGGFKSSLLDSLVASLNAMAKLLGIEIQWDSETIGCKPSLSSIPSKEQRLVEDAFHEIASWLHAEENKDEFLIIFFDVSENLGEWNKVPKLIEYMLNHFPAGEILTSMDDNRNYTDFPTIDTLLTSGKRVMFLSGADFSTQMKPYIFLKKSVCNWVEPEIPLDPFPVCLFIPSNVSTLSPQLTRPQSNEIVYGPLNADGKLGPNKGLLTEKTLPNLMKCGVNIPSPDNLTPQRMESMVWSWAKNEPLKHLLCTTLHIEKRRWKGTECSDDSLYLRPACKKNDQRHSWVLGTPTTACLADSACPEGTTFQAPVNGYENELILQIMKNQNVLEVWLNVFRNGCPSNSTLAN